MSWSFMAFPRIGHTRWVAVTSVGLRLPFSPSHRAGGAGLKCTVDDDP
jgi:hypothetical protein